MRKLFSVLSLVMLFVTISFGQTVNIPFSGTDGTTAIPLAVGLDLAATNCIDPALGESDLPPFPPAGVFDIRFDLAPYGCPALSTAKDYRNAAAFPFTGTVQHLLWWQVTTPGVSSIQLTYNLPTGASMTIVDNITGTLLNIGPFTGSGVAVIPASYTSFGTKAYMNMTYTNIGGAALPGFGIAPASLPFGNVDVGSSSMLQTTVTNTGTAPLVISNIVSSDAQFTFTPNVFPINIAAGANQVFDVTFAPAAIGSYNANLTFTHNAVGSPTVYAVTGNGTAPGLVDLENTFSGTDGTATILLATGLDAAATDCIDPALGESDLPPFPPAGVFDIRFDLSPTCPALSTLKDYRFAADPPNFNGTKQHTLWWQVSTPGVPITLNFNLDPNATMTIVDNITGTLLNLGPFTGSGVAVIPGSYTAFGTKAYMNIVYVAGVVTAPIFNVTPPSLDFGNVNQGTTRNLNVTVSNTGNANLVISSAAIAAPQYSVTPATATIVPGGNQVFTVTFSAPVAVGTYTGTLVFTDNAAGSPHSVPLTGNSIVPPPVFGLIFEQDTVFQMEDASYMEKIQLLNLGANAKAIQFRLETNKALDDNTILTFQSITKGSNVSDPSWILETNVVRGPITSNGASKDEIFVLLYNINQGPGWALGPGDYLDMFHVNYRVANLTGLQNNIKSSIQIAFEQGSTYDGNPIDITGSRDYLTVIAQATNGNGWGDVNGDGCVDILDLILVVDHIVGRDSIPAGSPAFARADIAPWPGTPEPQPDGLINVQDLSVIQNIILTGFFPNGNPVGPCGYVALPKSNGDEDAIVTIFINGEGISAYLDSRVGIRGAQIEFSSVASNPENMVINTPLGDGYYLRSDELLRTLMYDRQGQKYIGAGIDNFMADMPFNLKDPQDVSVAKLILVDMNRQKVGNIAIEVIYGQTPLPLDYILFQNYPNPFNPSTSVKFQVPKTSDVTIAVYDMLGQEVRTLFAGEVMRGTYTVNWDGINKEGAKVASGTYIYRMTAGEFIQSKKMVLIK
jgi:hypothetical protein